MITVKQVAWMMAAWAWVAPAVAQAPQPNAGSATPPSSAPIAAPKPAPLPPKILPMPHAQPRLPTKEGDKAYAAYQLGLYREAMIEAEARVKANPKDGPAFTLMGELYAKGFGVKPDLTKAAQNYQKAAAAGDPQGQYAWAMLKLEGKGTQKDEPGAKSLLEAASAKVPAAAYALGLILLTDGKPDSDRRAVSLFQDAALRGDADAQYGLAVLYKDGRGVAKNQTDAALWMGRAALGKNIAAETEYGIMLFNGEGIPRNEQAAAAMFRRAAEKGGAVAQNRLARLYFAGRGVQRDLVEGAKWAMLSMAQGLKDPWLDNAMRELTPGERRQAEEAVQRFLGP